MKSSRVHRAVKSAQYLIEGTRMHQQVDKKLVAFLGLVATFHLVHKTKQASKIRDQWIVRHYWFRASRNHF
jgi:hypothetical protein